MYTKCLRCDRSLGTNDELPHLPVGRRIAFDSERGRVWVVCLRCQQWNLLPLDRRWEALEDCKRVAATAESRVDGNGVGLARTTTGLTFLLATGVPKSDIANSRYGHRLRRRQRLLWWTAGALVVFTIALGLRAWFEGGSAIVGVFASAFAALWFWDVWRNPLRPWVRVASAGVKPKIIWGWRLSEIRFHVNPDASVALLVPHGRSETRLSGAEAVSYLAALLPKVNGADCVAASIPAAVASVSVAERRDPPTDRTRGKRHLGRNRVPRLPATPRRPWEWLARATGGVPLLRLPPEDRLALEMAVTEEVEQLALAEDAVVTGRSWPDEEEIGAIADDLLLPEIVQSRLDQLAKAKERRLQR